MSSLRSQAIRLAASNPDLRSHLLPILEKTAVKRPKKPTVDELTAWDHRRHAELAWVDDGEKWARDLWAKHPKLVEDPKFDPEDTAREMWSDAINQEEADSGTGWLGVQIGFVEELEKLSGRKFKRDNTAHSQEKILEWKSRTPPRY